MLGRYGFANAVIALQLAFRLLIPVTLVVGLFWALYEHGLEGAPEVILTSKVMVLAGVSTQPSGQIVTADDILRAIDATREFVDGYWFNIPEPSEYSPAVTEFRPDIAVEVFRQLSGR